MKAIEKMMRKMEPAHEGKWAKFHPLWDGFYTFLFTPGETTKKGAHIRDGIDLKRTMAMVIVALLPCLLWGMYNTGHWHMVVETNNFDLPYWDDFGAKLGYGFLQILPLIIVSYGVGLGVEFAFAIKNGHPIQEGFLVSGMLIPLIVPSDIPLWMVAVATVFAVVLAKEVFGGTGMNVVNVALMARAFLFFAYPSRMAGDKIWMSGLEDKVASNALLDASQKVDIVSGATPLGELATWPQGQPIHGSLEAFEAKWDFWEVFWGYMPGSVGETSFFCCMIGAVILLYTGIASWKIIVSFFAGGLAVAALLNGIAPMANAGDAVPNLYLNLSPMYHIILGGFAFGAVFMATDPVTAAQTSTGKYIYGFLAGGMAIVIRVLNPAFPEGVMMAILLMNVFAPLIDHYVIQSNIKRRLKRTLKTA